MDRPAAATERRTGRDAVRDGLLRLAEETRAGHGAAVLVRGEAGIGKTTLVATALTSAADQVVWGRAGRAGDDLPYAPWRAILAELLSDHASREAVAGRDAWALRVAAPDLWRELGADPDPRADIRSEVFEALARMLERAASRAPVRLIVDDLHDADVASILLFATLADRAPLHRLLLVATVRTDEWRSPEHREALALVQRTATVLDVPGLDRDSIAALGADAGIELDPAVVDVLSARTRGNAFFVTRLIGLLASRQPEQPTMLRIAENEVPTEVAEVIRARIARLPEPTVELLQLAAVVGDGRISDLAGVSGRSATEVLDAFATAGALVVETAPDRFAFAHSLVRDGIDATLSPARRRELHLAALRHLPPADGNVAARARHALAARPLSDIDETVDLCVDAARVALAHLAYEDAASHFDDALAVGGDEPADRRRVAILLDLGDALRAGGATARARQVCGEAAAFVRDDPALLARAALGYADPGADLGLAFRSLDPATATLLEHAIEAQPDPATPAGVRLRARLASELYFSSESPRAEPLATEAVELAAIVGDDAATVAALATFHDGFVLGCRPPAEAVALADRILVHARSCREPTALLTAYRCRVLSLLAAGHLAAVDVAIGDFAHLVETARLPSHRWWPALWNAMRKLTDGDHAGAEEAMLTALTEGRDAFGLLAESNASFLLFFLRREQGRLEELEAPMRGFARVSSDIPAVRPALALLLAELGHAEDARAVLDQLLADGLDRLADRNWPASRFLIARAVLLAGHEDAAARLVAVRPPASGECVGVSLGTVCLGSAALAQAWLLDALGDGDGADREYREAAAVNARIGARAWLAQTWADHAALLARAGGRGGEARRLAAKATALAEEIGLVAVLGGREPTVATPGVDGHGRFERVGDVWHLEYVGVAATVRHSKGLTDLAELLRRAHQPIPATALLAPEVASHELAAGRGDPIFDERARSELRARWRELEVEIAEAENANDLERASRARMERDALVDATTAAFGLGDRSRRIGDDAERARKAVTARIRNAIARIEIAHPPLGSHLERSVDTGSACVYRPEHTVEWRL
ncbi:MAG: ATP-binding protein [Acidimicrobiia bacterium]